MEQLSDEQSRIDRRRREVSARYPQMISDLIAEWHSPDTEDRAWLLYSANYLFRTGGVRWAMDPLSLRHRIPEAPAVDLVRSLNPLDFVVLTHRHADHLDFDLLKAMRRLPIQWVIPDYILPQVQAEVDIPLEQVIVLIFFSPLTLKASACSRSSACIGKPIIPPSRRSTAFRRWVTWWSSTAGAGSFREIHGTTSRGSCRHLDRSMDFLHMSGWAVDVP